MMDMKQLEALVYVVETGSFSRAGELLHLTQPTISSHIASLERELKIKLIVRTTKEIYPSEAGKRLYGYAKEILSTREEAIHAIGDFFHEMRGTITVAASTIPGQYFLPRMMQSFREKYPDIKFRVQMADSADVADLVMSRCVELGFTGTLSSNPKCISREFAQDRLVIITPNLPRYAQYLTVGFPVSRITEEPFISREHGSGTRRETELFLQEMGVDPRALQLAVEVRSTESIKKMVSEGLGIAVLSRSACEDYVQFERLLAFDFDHAAIQRKLYMVRHRNNILSPIVRTFYDYAKNYYIKK